jgi:hypothetical protein
MVTDTSIAIATKTKERLKFVKLYPRETFDDILNRLLDEYDKHYQPEETH